MSEPTNVIPFRRRLEPTASLFDQAVVDPIASDPHSQYVASLRSLRSRSADRVARLRALREPEGENLTDVVAEIVSRGERLRRLRAVLAELNERDKRLREHRDNLRRDIAEHDFGRAARETRALRIALGYLPNPEGLDPVSGMKDVAPTE